jgi:hypothetical protein
VSETFRDTIANCLKDLSFSLPATSSHLSAEAQNTDTYVSASPKYSCIDGSVWKVDPKKHYPSGHALSWRVRGNFRFSEQQKEFLNWGYQLGVKNKSDKLTAHLAADIMKLVGTVEGERMFPNEPYMKASPDGTARFKRKDLIMHYEIKSFFGQTTTKKK